LSGPYRSLVEISEPHVDQTLPLLFESAKRSGLEKPLSAEDNRLMAATHVDACRSQREPLHITIPQHHAIKFIHAG
jgi:hypothetical protein